MADLTRFRPLVQETVDTIGARMDADANAGVDPSDPSYIDTTEGSVWHDWRQTTAIEFERAYDFAATEVPASAMIPFSWGIYLDTWGIALNLPRKDEVRASGEVTFVGDAGTFVPAGTRVATIQIDPDEDPAEFQTLASRALAAAPGPAALDATPLATGGTLPAGTYYYVMTAVVDGFETVVSNEDSASVTGATSRVTLAATPVAGATEYRIYRGAAPGAEVRLATSATASYNDTGAATPTGQAFPSNEFAVEAIEAGAAGNVPSGTVTQLMTPLEGIESVSNQQSMSGGAEVETDELYAERLSLEFAAAQGAGNIDDYRRWALGYAPVGFATVQPLWSGNGTVRVIVTDQDNNPVSGSVVAGLQELLDPVPAQGVGLAPIGAAVTVATPSQLAIDVSATVALLSGYSLDGGGGSIAVRDDIEASLAEYIDKLNPGDDVLLNRTESRFFGVQGVYNVSGVQLNGAAADAAVGATQVASLGTVTLA